MSNISFRIPLVIPSQKNLKRIAINKRTGKQFIMSDKRVKDWRREASFYIPKKHIDGPMKITFAFTHKDRRRKDLDNQVSSLLDLFTVCGLIDDDSCMIVKEIRAIFVGTDRENYGVDIDIEQITS